MKKAKVVAALIRENDKFLICQRPANKARGLLWEFVGGKMEPGETEQEALKRECMEELGIEVFPIKEYMRVEHKYPDIAIELILYETKIIKGTIQKIEHNDWRYIRISEISQYEFCPADLPILEALKREREKM